MTDLLLRPEQHWVCPNCTATDVTHEAQPHTRFHACRGLRGLTAPLVADGTRCKVELVRPGDYIAKAGLMHLDDEGRPAAAVVTTRDDGNDCAVLAPCALGRIGE